MLAMQVAQHETFSHTNKLHRLNARKSIKEELADNSGLISIPLAIRGGSDGAARQPSGAGPVSNEYVWHHGHITHVSR